MNFQGTNYVVSDQVFKQFKTGYEQAQKQGNKRTSRSPRSAWTRASG